MLGLENCSQSYTKSGAAVVTLCGVEHFNVAKIFDCGQCFRFDEVKDSIHSVEYAGCAHGKYISVAQDSDKIYIYNSTVEEYESIWKKYLALDRDYGEINCDIAALSENPALRDAMDKSDGIRILYQEGWESVCSFIISQNNNIPRIKKLIDALCQRCGDRIDISNMEGHIAQSHKNAECVAYSFPSPEKILPLGIEGLAALKVGFRAKYIYDAADKISRGEIDLDTPHGMDTASAVEYLCRIKGIGIKVASCALLFGFAKLDAFPIDVWIKRVMAKYFDADFDYRELGKYAGVAQQYLFYYERYIQSLEA